MDRPAGPSGRLTNFSHWLNDTGFIVGPHNRCEAGTRVIDRLLKGGEFKTPLPVCSDSFYFKPGRRHRFSWSKHGTVFNFTDNNLGILPPQTAGKRLQGHVI